MSGGAEESALLASAETQLVASAPLFSHPLTGRVASAPLSSHPLTGRVASTPLSSHPLTGRVASTPLSSHPLYRQCGVSLRGRVGFPSSSRPPYPPPRPGVSLLVPAVLQRLDAARQSTAPMEVPDWSAMTLHEQFARAFLTLRHAFGGAAAHKLWALLASEAGAGVASEEGGEGGGGGSSSADALSLALLESSFKAAWKAAAKAPVGVRAKLAAKKSLEQVSVCVWGGGGEVRGPLPGAGALGRVKVRGEVAKQSLEWMCVGGGALSACRQSLW